MNRNIANISDGFDDTVDHTGMTRTSILKKLENEDIFSDVDKKKKMTSSGMK